MFIPNCKTGDHNPPLQELGSSNIWANETFKYSKISNPTQLWTYQDVLDLKDRYLSLYDIIKAILKCQKGIVHDITNQSEISIRNDHNKIMDIPVPKGKRGYFKRVQDFLSENKSIESYNYYRFDDVFDSIKDYKENREIQIPNTVENKSAFNSESLSQYETIVRESFEVVKNDI